MYHPPPSKYGGQGRSRIDLDVVGICIMKTVAFKRK